MDFFHKGSDPPPPFFPEVMEPGGNICEKHFFGAFSMFLMESLGRGYTEGKLWIKFHLKKQLKIIFCVTKIMCIDGSIT